MRFRRIPSALLLLPLLAVVPDCGSGGEAVRRVRDGGVETVLNPREAPRPSRATLTKLYALDTAREDLAARGFLDPDLGFEPDSRGALFAGCSGNAEGPLLSFDASGAFVRAFGRIGQGPGEIQPGGSLAVSARDEVLVTDPRGRKLVAFSTEGRLLREVRFEADVTRAAPLPDGRFVAWSWTPVMDPQSEFLAVRPLSLAGPDLRPVRELDRQTIPNPFRGGGFPGTFHVFSWSASAGRVFTAFQDRGYEVRVYDLDGRLVRRIRKESAPVAPPQTYKDEVLRQFAAPVFEDLRSRIVFPPALPPMDGIAADDEGRLYVATFEPGREPGTRRVDVFEADGGLAGRLDLALTGGEPGARMVVRGGRLFALGEDEAGHRRIQAYSLAWRR